MATTVTSYKMDSILNLQIHSNVNQRTFKNKKSYKMLSKNGMIKKVVIKVGVTTPSTMARLFFLDATNKVKYASDCYVNKVNNTFTFMCNYRAPKDTELYLTLATDKDMYGISGDDGSDVTSSVYYGTYYNPDGATFSFNASAYNATFGYEISEYSTTNKYLIAKHTADGTLEYLTVEGGVILNLGTPEPTENTFVTRGFTDEVLATLNNVNSYKILNGGQLLVFCDEPEWRGEAKLSYVQEGTLQFAEETGIDVQGYSGINRVDVSSYSGRCAVSFDQGVTLYSRQITVKETFPDNAVPTMTSDVTPQGTCSASSSCNFTNYDYWNGQRVTGGFAYNAFDGKKDVTIANPGIMNMWVSGGVVKATQSQWIQYGFLTPKLISEYAVTSGKDAVYYPQNFAYYKQINNDPSEWSLQGSFDGTKWYTLDTRTNQTFSAPGTTNKYTIQKPYPFKFYRLEITKVKAGPGNYVGIQELELFEGTHDDTWINIQESEIPTKGLEPEWLSLVTPEKWAEIFVRKRLDIYTDVKDAATITGLTVILPDNQPPKILNLSLNPTVLHNGSAMLKFDLLDPEGQQSEYRIRFDDQTLVDWKAFGDKAHIEYPVDLDKYSNGVHTVYIDARDSLGVQNSTSLNISRINNAPVCSVTWDSTQISAYIGDMDNDKVKYRFLLNGAERIPWTPWLDSGASFNCRFRKHELIVGKQNKLRIEFMDGTGAEGYWEAEVEGRFINLMFQDSLGNNYSDDYGNTLTLLDLGTLVAGYTTFPVDIYLKNNTGWPIENIKITTNNPYTPEVGIELGYVEGPFSGSPEISSPTVLADGDRLKFYLRLKAEDNAYRGGDFKISASGDIVI